MLGTSLSEFDEDEIVTLLKRNIVLFAWVPSDMLGTNTKVVCHQFTIDLTIKKCLKVSARLARKKRVAIDEEVHKLASSCFITEVKYPS